MFIFCKSYLHHFAIFFLFIVVKFLSISVSGYTFFPADYILVDCGASGNSTSLDGRQWTGDVGSKFISLNDSIDTSSSSKALDLPTSAYPVPYRTVRIFHSQLIYAFHVSSGQKFIRLYFNPTSVQELNRSKAFFNVTTGPFTLLSNFSLSSFADSFVKEFCINIGENQVLNVTFSPDTSNGAYGIISGIEIVSMPTSLYYTGTGHNIGRYLQNHTALEMIHRLNVGRSSILPVNDSGMFRSWIEDRYFVFNLPSTREITNRTTRINFTTIPSYAAPRELYQTARSTGKGMNLTWKLPVDSGFKYLVRLHFCELQLNKKRGDREFQIFIANRMVEPSADIIRWTGGNGIPVFRDYIVMLPNLSRKKNNLSVSLRPKGKSDPILNGLELFKINNTDGNLCGHNAKAFIAAAIPRPPDKLAKKSKNTKTKIVVIIVGVTTVVIIVLLLVGFTICWHWKRARFDEENMKPQPEGICRRFAAEEIRNATNNFDRALVIGDGGFGRVFKGNIDSENTPVAVKALKPTSSQGSREFWAEIEMLSKLRHPHLVSLVGYCNDERLMILVYDYMAQGTLRDHLYHTHNPPLSWKQRLEICIGAAYGIKYLHTGAEHSIIHRDIKSSNILLDEKWVPKVSDFGLSRLGPTSMSRSHVTTDVKGTFGYLDPEYYFTNHLSVKSDVFSFGVLLFEVLCARPAVDMRLEEEQHSLVLWARTHVKEGTLDQIIDPSLTGKIAPESLKVYATIAAKCLREHRNERPTMSKVLRKLELALRLQECADAAAEVGILHSELSSLRGNRDNSGCIVHSCPAIWKKTLSPREPYRFFSDRARVNNKLAKPSSLRGLRGLIFAILGYKSLSREKGQSTCSSTCEPDLTSEKMLIEIMASPPADQ
ncbi:hypothetical protein P3X46_016351 [Hevea brasiliensis]|uniref:Protein kinase domain-containing protein n=1 Tax=Hevea brasiliensis TaxID=3981 RepID=A0ABQ9M0P3_HEVBR|nr:receptor-like protein kinase FERONIA [Hevea brasiliensis]KAJ9173188.1 hypothetical protein P3X46_016351 [Hevea brasiliensis]